MPGGDGIGPMGSGPMTGRGAGFCNGFDRPGYANFGMGRGFRGRGRGLGYGFRARRNWFGAGPRPMLSGYDYNYAAPTREQELEMLQTDAEEMKQAMEQINDRIKQLKEQK